MTESQSMEDMIYRRKMVMTMGVSTKDNDAEADDCKDLNHDDHDDGSQADRDVMDAAAAYNRPSSNNCLLLLLLIIIIIITITIVLLLIIITRCQQANMEAASWLYSPEEM